MCTRLARSQSISRFESPLVKNPLNFDASCRKPIYKRGNSFFASDGSPKFGDLALREAKYGTEQAMKNKKNAFMTFYNHLYTRHP